MATNDLRLSFAGGRLKIYLRGIRCFCSKAAMHGERISVRHIAVKESEVIDWQDHI